MFSPEKQVCWRKLWKNCIWDHVTEPERANQPWIFLHAALSKCGLRFPLFSGDARENKQIEQLFRGLMLSKNAQSKHLNHKSLYRVEEVCASACVVVFMCFACVPYQLCIDTFSSFVSFSANTGNKGM